MKVMVIDVKKLSLEEYFNKIKPYMRDILTDLQESGT